MEVRETYGLGVESVEVGRLQNWVPMTRQVAVALIIGHHEDDIGPRLSE